MILIGTSSGKVKLIDLEKNRVVWKGDIVENGCIFDIEYSHQGILAIATIENTVFFKKYDHKIRSFSELSNLPVGDSARCLEFNPNKPNQIAIGLFNGTTIIYDLDTLKVEATLKSGSSQRILCLAWNP